MGNTLLTPQIIANEALLVLENTMVMSQLVHKDYSSEFVNVGDTISIRKPATFRAQNFTGSIINQDATESSVPVVMDRFKDISFSVAPKEMTLDINNFSQQFIAPAMRAVAQGLDEDIFNEVANISQSVTATSNPTSLADIANMAKTLDIAKVPTDMRHLVFNPKHKYSYALTDNLSKVSYAGTGDTLRNSELGNIYGFDTYMDQNAPDTLAATAGTATGYTVTGAKDATTVALASVTSTTATVKTGDGFILDGHMYRFTADASATAGAVASVTIDMPLVKAYTTATVYLVNKTHSLAFHHNAIALVTRPLALPMGAAQSAVQSYNGMTIRVVYGYNQTTKTDTVSLDLIYGIKTLDPTLAVKLVG
jgi:hypothetical protein